MAEALSCEQREDGPSYWFKSRCGADRDCVPDDRQAPFPVGWCGAMEWVAKGNGRYVEVWEPHNARRMFTIRAKHGTPDRVARCARSNARRQAASYGASPGDDRFTVSIPGLSDVLRLPGIDTAETRRERISRWRQQRSPMPGILAPLQSILTKLDDAQDLLFTALAIGSLLFRWAGLRMIPGLGWLLTINDLLNGMT